MAVFLDKCFFMIRDVFQVLTTQFLVVCVCVCLSLDLQSICYSVNRNSLQRVDYTRRRERIIVILFFSSEAPCCCCCCTRWISPSFSFIFFRNRTTYSCFILVDATVVRISGTTQLFLFSFTWCICGATWMLWRTRVHEEEKELLYTHTHPRESCLVWIPVVSVRHVCLHYTHRQREIDRNRTDKTERRRRKAKNIFT